MIFKVFGDSTSLIVNLTQDGVAVMIPENPTGTVSELDFDDTTNSSLAQDLIANPYAYKLVNNALQRNGIAVTIAAPSADYSVRNLAQQIESIFRQGTLANASTLQSDITAIQGGTATLTQVQRVMVLLMRIFAWTIAQLIKRNLV